MTFDEALKNGWEPLIKPEMLDEFKKSWSHVLETGEDFKMELQLKRKMKIHIDGIYTVLHQYEMMKVSLVPG